jgi:hypothetical protein
MIILGALSKRLGKVTRAPRYYLGFYIAAGFMGLSVLARFINVSRGVAGDRLQEDPLWVLLYVGFPAMAMTLGVIVAWRYWSWLLAERG